MTLRRRAGGEDAVVEAAQQAHARLAGEAEVGRRSVVERSRLGGDRRYRGHGGHGSVVGRRPGCRRDGRSGCRARLVDCVRLPGEAPAFQSVARVVRDRAVVDEAQADRPVTRPGRRGDGVRAGAGEWRHVADRAACEPAGAGEHEISGVDAGHVLAELHGPGDGRACVGDGPARLIESTVGAVRSIVQVYRVAGEIPPEPTARTWKVCSPPASPVGLSWSPGSSCRNR